MVHNAASSSCKINQFSSFLCKYTYLRLASVFVEGMTVCRTQASVVMREFTTGPYSAASNILGRE